MHHNNILVPFFFRFMGLCQLFFRGMDSSVVKYDKCCLLSFSPSQGIILIIRFVRDTQLFVPTLCSFEFIIINTSVSNHRHLRRTYYASGTSTLYMLTLLILRKSFLILSFSPFRDGEDSLNKVPKIS